LSTSFNEQFEQHGAWRREFALRLKLLGEWMSGHGLLDPPVAQRLVRLENQIRADKVMVAFVGEFSRGKSELVNAIFFSHYGRRIMPASAGRTTMCPTEIGYESEGPPSLRLLPIETRLTAQSLMEWRQEPEKWARIDLDVNNPAQLALALEKVAETRQVTQDEARALGYWNNQTPDDNPMVNAKGLVEVPKWRHALINIAHPLLKQGLVILDTPGLNATGAEPELTVSLIPQAHAIIFVLGADTGVTKSDLSIWREHLVAGADPAHTRLVVLNKIDTLWDALSTSAQVQTQIERQRVATAKVLGVALRQVIAVSAQKGLVGKVTDDAPLLQRSALLALEAALGNGILGQRQQILGSAVATAVSELRAESGRVIHTRRRDLVEQGMELNGLQGKNASVIKHLRLRITHEQAEFDLGGAKIHAVRSVHLKLLREVFGILGAPAVKLEMNQLTDALQQKGFKLGVKKAYGETFGRLRANLNRVQAITAEIQTMLGAAFRQLNAEHGFSLQAPSEPVMGAYVRDLDLVERSHLQYLGIGNAFRLAQPEFADRLIGALEMRLRVIHEIALGDVELWSKSAAAQLDAQLRERRRHFDRRLEAIDRIQQAAGGLGDRIEEIRAQEKALDQLDAKLLELTSHLIAAPPMPEVSAAHNPVVAVNSKAAAKPGVKAAAVPAEELIRT
jgi:Dynamin family